MGKPYLGDIDKLVTQEEYDARPTVGKELKKGISRGTDLLQSNLYGYVATQANKAGATGIRDWAESGQQRNVEEASQNAAAVGSTADIAKAYQDNGLLDAAGKAALLASGGIGELIPQVGSSVAAYTVGRRLGGKAGIGGLTGGALTAGQNVAQETGSIYGDILEKTGQRESDIANTYGLGAGLIDTATDMIPLGKLAGNVGADRIGASILKEGVKQVAIEAPTEGAQTVIERAAVAKVDPSQEVFSPEGRQEIVDAMALGALGGGVAGAGAEGIGRGINALTSRQVPQQDQMPDPVEHHVNKQVQAAASIDPSAGPLSAAVSAGVQTGAVAQAAAKQVTEDPAAAQQAMGEAVQQQAAQQAMVDPRVVDVLPDVPVELQQRLSASLAGFSPERSQQLIQEISDRRRRVALASDPVFLAEMEAGAKRWEEELAAENDLQSRRAAIEPRLALPEFRDTLERMAQNAGWEERGGKVIMQDLEGNGRMTATGRTPWVPKEQWYVGGLGTPEQIQTAVGKAIRGEKLGNKQRQIVEYMLDFAGDNIITGAQMDYAAQRYLDENGIDAPGNMTPEEADAYFNSPEFDQAFASLAPMGEDLGSGMNPAQEALTEFVQAHAGDPDVPEAVAIAMAELAKPGVLDNDPATISATVEAIAAEPTNETGQAESQSQGGTGRGAEGNQEAPLLTSYTEEEVAAKAQREQDEAARKQAEDDAFQKATADAFQLTTPDDGYAGKQIKPAVSGQGSDMFAKTRQQEEAQAVEPESPKADKPAQDDDDKGTYWADRASDLHDVAVVLRGKMAEQPNGSAAVIELSAAMAKFQELTGQTGRKPKPQEFKQSAEELAPLIGKYTGGQDIDGLVEKYGSFGTKEKTKAEPAATEAAPTKKRNALAEAAAKRGKEKKDAVRNILGTGAKVVDDKNSVEPPKDNGMIGTGDQLYSATGRKLSPAPKIDTSTPMKLQSSIRRMNKWLHEEAMKEAVESGSDWNETLIKAIDLKNMSIADKATLNIILFGDQDGVAARNREPGNGQPIDPRGRSPLKDISPSKKDDAAPEPAQKKPKKALDAISTIKGILGGGDGVREEGPAYGDNDGLTPEQRQQLGLAAIALGDYYMEIGILKFGEFARQMLLDIGDRRIKGFIENAYAGARNNLRKLDRDKWQQTDKADTVESLVDNGFLDDLKGVDYESRLIGDAEQDQKNESGEDGSKGQLHEYIADRLGEIKNNNDLKSVLADYHGRQPTEAQIKDGQEAVELALVIAARDVVAGGGDMRDVFDELLEMYQSQPLLNSRTSTSMENQAYSTPLPLAYLAGKLAGVSKDVTVFEPTAGNGALLIDANPAKTHANEINDSRRNALKRQGFVVTGNDATDVVPLGVPVPIANNGKADAVVMNPPFGALEGEDARVDGFAIGKIDHLIAAKALANMKDDGRATMIIGANKAAGAIGRQDRIFFNWLYSNYNVVDHFEVDGRMYARQGAGWPVAVITVSGRKASDRVSPKEGEIARLDNWEQVYERTTKTLDTIGQLDVDRNDSGTVRSGQRESGSNDSPVPSGDQAGETGQRVRPGTRSGGSGKSGTGSRDSSGGPTGNRSGRTRQMPGGERSDTNGNQRDGSGQQEARTDDQFRGDETVPDYDVSRSAKGNRPDVAGSEYQTKYESGSNLTDDGALVPVNMKQAIDDAIADLKDAVGGSIDNYVMRKLKYTSQDEYEKAFMGLQADTIAAAIHNMEDRGKGIIIADQTGVGKGRQGAGIMRWAIKNGKIPVFVSVKQNLFTDIYDDSMDIGLREISPFIMNDEGGHVQKNGAKLFDMSSSERKKRIAYIVRNGRLPEGANALFLTYSQITRSDAVQREAIARLVDSNKDKVVFILDESHNVSGEMEAKKSRKAGGGVSITGAGFMNRIITGMPVTYLSATYAKRPDNMPIYHRTDLMDAVDSTTDLINAVSRGGEALQTVISNALTRSGQLWRREKSYEGIEIRTIVETKNSEKHARISDNVTMALKAIIYADNILSAWLDQGGANTVLEYHGITSGSASHFGGKVEQHLSHSPFTSIVHNYVRQMLLGLKADWIVEESLELIRQGKKPVIALENTMGSFLKDAIADGEASIGDAWDGDFGMILEKALSKTARVTIENNAGESTRVRVPEHLMPPIVRSAYETAKNAIASADVSGIPVMPIDYIRTKLEQAGVRTGEITGRDIRLDYSTGIPTIARRDKDDTNRRGSVDRFNAGQIDAIILNAAGSTGLSIHSRKDFSDTRPRHMLVAQPMLDINILMQMLGRINRTGQVTTPEYSLMGLDLPAEKRPLAIANKKMKSLNANTSANTKSDTSLNAPDIMNKYGAMVISDFLADNPDISNAVNVESVSQDESVDADYAIKVTGRFALLPVEVQRFAYEEIERSYNELIAFLDATGQNDLKTDALDLQASIIETTEIYEGKFPGRQLGGNAYMHSVVVNVIGSNPEPSDVSDKIKSALGGKTPIEFVEEMEKEGDEQQKKISGERIEAEIDRLEGELGRAIDDKARSSIVADIAKLRSTRDSAMALQSATKERLRKLTIGTEVRLDTGDETVSGVIVNVEKRYNPEMHSGSPWAPSRYRVTIAVNSTARYITVPLSRLSSKYDGGLLEASGTPSSDTVAADVEKVFSKDTFTTGKERRYIATGNLVGAFSKINGGRIVNFTAANGRQYQGILMPRKFGNEEMQLIAGAPKNVRDPGVIAQYLRSIDRDSVLSDIGISSIGMVVKIAPSRRGSGYTITIPTKSDTTGDALKFDKDLHEIMGEEFVGRGKYMTASFSDAALDNVVSHVMQKMQLLVPSIGSQHLDSITGGSKKAPVRSFDMNGNDTDGVAYTGAPVPTQQEKDGQSAPAASSWQQSLASGVRPTNTPPNSAGEGAVSVIEGRDTRDGSPHWNVKIQPRLGDNYPAVVNIAKRHGGFWSRFTKAFLFKDAGKAEAFADDARKFLADNNIKEAGGDYLVSERRRSRNQGDLFRKPPGKPSAIGTDEQQLGLFDNLPEDPKAQAAQVRDNLFVRAVLEPLTTFSVATKKIRDAEDAAHIFAPLRRQAVESMMVAVVDADGNVIEVIQHSTGSKDAASVYPGEIAAAAASLDGAAGIWLAHNHPSGVTDQSQADQRITRVIADSLRGTGVKYLGHVVLGASGNSAHIDETMRTGQIKARPGYRKHKVEVKRTVLRKRLPAEAMVINSPAQARGFTNSIEHDDAVILLDTQHRVVGVLGMTPAEMRRIADGGAVKRLAAAVHGTNAAAAIIKTTGESYGKNTGTMLATVFDLRVLDILVSPDGRSLTEAGIEARRGGVWHRRDSAGQRRGVDRKAAEKAVEQFMRDYSGAKQLGFKLYDTAEQAYGIKKLREYKVENQVLKGGYHMGKVHLILDSHNSVEDLLDTMRHETWAHFGFDLVTPERKAKILADIKADINSDGALRAFYNQVVRSYRKDDQTLPPEEVLLEETVARIAEVYGDRIHSEATGTGFAAALRRVFERIKDYLRSVGLMKEQDGIEIVVSFLTRQARTMRGDANTAFAANTGMPMFRREDQTETPEFKRWFGDSKVVDADGKPLVVYHGTDATRTVFDRKHLGRSSGRGTGTDWGFFFAKDRDHAEYWANNAGGDRVVESVYLRIENPLVIEDSGNDGGATLDRILDERLQDSDHDGAIIHGMQDDDSGELRTAYLVFDSEQIKSAIGNRGTFDPENPDIRFRRGPVMTKEQIRQELRDATGGMLTDLKPALLATIPLNYMKDFARREVTAVSDYIDIKRKLDKTRDTMVNRYDARAKDWLGWHFRNKKESQSLMDLMHDSTIVGQDPAEPFVETGNAERDAAAKAEWGRLRARYMALPERAQQLYREVRDDYAKQRKDLDAAIEANIKKTAVFAAARAEREYTREVERIQEDGLPEDERLLAMDKAANKRDKKVAAAEAGAFGRVQILRKLFESGAVSGPYFPLHRSGDYFVAVYNPAGGIREVRHFERAAEQAAFVREQREAGYKVRHGRKSNKQDIAGAVDPRFVADVDEVLAGIDGAEPLRDEIYQRYLESLPDMSVRKSFIHRKKTPGWNPDALKAYSHRMFHGAHQIARLSYRLDLEDALERAEDQARAATDPVNAQALVNEMRKRHEWVMNPHNSAASQWATTAAFVYYLGASPAQLLLNASQTVMMGIPILGSDASRGGFDRAGKELVRASRDFFAGNGDVRKALKGDELDAMTEFYDLGLIDRGQTYDLAGISENGSGYSAIRTIVMEKIGWFFQKAEVYNREVTALAAYRMARSAGVSHKDAIKEAADKTWQAHFDYTAGNRARIMQGDWPRVFLVFRQYSINMLYRLFRDIRDSFRGESPAIRKQAQRQLGAMMGMYAMMAGAAGVPFYGVAMTIAKFLFEDEDEDLEQEFKAGVVEFLGPTVGRAALFGVPGTFFNVDLTSRIGMGNLWFRDLDAQLEGKDAYWAFMQQLLGAVPAIGGQLATATKMALDGHYARAFETAIPTALRGGWRAARYAIDGGADTLSGDRLADTDYWDALSQAIGFTPAHIAERYDTNAAIRNVEAKLRDERRSLLNGYAMAIKTGEGKADAMKSIQEFNRRYPGLRITPQSIQQSLKTRAKRDAGTENGLYLDRKLGAIRDRMELDE